MTKTGARGLGGALLLMVGAMTPAPGVGQVEFTHMRGDGRDVRMTEVADGVYQFMTMRDSYVRQLNSVAVVTDRDVLVFDTDTRPSTARAILARIRKITRKPVRYVVNSHGHPDHWSGNEVYADAFPDLEIIATAETAAFMRRMASVWGPRLTEELKRRQGAFATERSTGLGEDGVAVTDAQMRQDESDLRDFASLTDELVAVRRVFPTLTFTDSLRITHGGREFLFLDVTGDSQGTTVLYLPRDRVLITGDAVSYPIPYVSRNPVQQAKDVRRIMGLAATVIVPGHGPAFHDESFLDLEARLLEAVIDGVAKARSEGVSTLEDLERVVTVDELREPFAHGDPDLETRFRTRVKNIIAFLEQSG
jgi:cyclase